MKRNYKKLTQVDVEFLKLNYKHLSDKALAKALGRTSTTVRKHRQLLRLNRRGVSKDTDKTKVIVWMPRKYFSKDFPKELNITTGDKNE